MKIINKKYVLVEDNPITNPINTRKGMDGDILTSRLENFCLSSDFRNAIWNIERGRKDSQILIGGGSCIQGIRIEDKLLKSNLILNSLLIPENKFKLLSNLKLDFENSDFNFTFGRRRNSPYTIYEISSESMGYDSNRINYLVFPEHDKFNDILDYLGAPTNFLIK